MQKRNKHNKSNSDDHDDDTGKRRNKKVFAFLARGLDGHMTQLGEKKGKRLFSQKCKLFATKKIAKVCKNIKPQKKLLHHSQTLIALRNSFATQQQKTQIICNSKAKKLPIFGANVPKAKSKSSCFIQVFQNQSKKSPVLCNCSRTKGKIPYFGANVSKIKEIYYTATISTKLNKIN
jgi:hypothetical protein